MKKLTFLFLLLIFILPSNVEATTGSVYCPDDDLPLTIRGSIGGAGIGSATCNSKVEILEENAGSTINCLNWHKIDYNGKVGYVCGNYIKIDRDVVEKAKVLCEENDAPLSMWDSISLNTRITRLSCDTEVDVLDKNAGTTSGVCDKWYKISYNNTIGYACGDYLRKSSEGSSSGTTSSGTSTNPNVGKSSGSDNIYIKENYDNKLSADGTISCFEDTGDINLKSSAGSGSNTGKAKCGDVVTINSVAEKTGSCKYYYNVTNQRGETGYLCGYFVNTTKLSDFAKNYYEENGTLESYTNELKQKKFPDSYIPYLLEVHARNPKWKFTAELINLDFNTVVANEAYTSRNLLEKAYFSENYLSMGLNSYDILTDTFIQDPDEDGYYNASTEAIAYYLDPRTYLNERYIFAFETLYYNSMHDSNMVKKILSAQTFWPSVYNGFPSNVYDDVIKASNSENANISAIHVASRIKQEISWISDTDPRLGGKFKVDGVEHSGYYNFFNIDVWGTDKITRGMKYAMNNSWDTPYEAILGGAKFIREGYIGVNQDTVYYQKFDVSTTNGHYDHQFMQNLGAVAQETGIARGMYVSFGNYLDQEIEFVIPVYNNMSNYAVTSPTLGNPNNYLKDLTIDGKTIDGFVYDKTSYDITLPSTTNSIVIDATKINANASVKGTGTIKIDGNKKIEVVVTAESGRNRTYTINITKQQSSNNDDNTGDNNTGDNNTGNNNPPVVEEVAMSTILNNSGLKYNNNFMFGVQENTGISTVVENIKDVSKTASVTIKDKNGNAKSGVFKTGDTITISNNKETKTFSIVMYGDVNGDGKINKDDCLTILRQLKGYTKLDGAFKEAGDANKSGKIDKDDCLAILRQLKGYTNLNK